VTHVASKVRRPHFSAAFGDADHGAQCGSDPEPGGKSNTAQPAPRNQDYYVIDETSQQESTRPRGGSLGAPAVEPRTPGDVATFPATRLHRATELLTLALGGAVRAGSVVRFRDEHYVIVPIEEVPTLEHGEAVAVYGRFSVAEWKPQARVPTLLLKSEPRSLQVWTSAGVARHLLQVERTELIVAPLFAAPMPFLAFGTLAHLDRVSGVRVEHSARLVTYDPFRSSARPVAAPAERRATPPITRSTPTTDRAGAPPAPDKPAELHQLPTRPTRRTNSGSGATLSVEKPTSGNRAGLQLSQRKTLLRSVVARLVSVWAWLNGKDPGE
jgi:hypothetical protein